MAKHRDEGVANWGDRAVTVPLRRDGVPTYFVPLSCGATGNCTWGIIAKSPVRSLGVVNGAIIFVSTRSREWPDVSVLSTAGAGDATMETLKFVGDGYQRSKLVKVDPGLAQKLGGCIDDESCCPRPAT